MAALGPLTDAQTRVTRESGDPRRCNAHSATVALGGASRRAWSTQSEAWPSGRSRGGESGGEGDQAQHSKEVASGSALGSRHRRRWRFDFNSIDMREILLKLRRSKPMAESPRAVFHPDRLLPRPESRPRLAAEAFGFEISLLVTDDDGNVGHAETSFEGASVGVGGEFGGDLLGGAQMKSPASLAGASSQFIWVNLTGDLDQHCATATAAGRGSPRRRGDQFYGRPHLSARWDPEGHVWCFRKPVAVVSVAEMEKASGLKISTGASA